MLAYIKINDGVHNFDLGGPQLVKEIKEMLRDKTNGEVGLFLDMKIFDVSETLKNYANKYAAEQPDILTVSSQCSLKGIIALRQKLPFTRLALISVPTDMSAEECQRRFGLSPALKILADLGGLRQEYQEKRFQEYQEKRFDEGLNLPKEAFDLVVCSSEEVAFLKSNLPASYGFIVPGIRDKWMLADHQKRIAGACKALDAGATLLVMGAQLVKGNPEKGITPAQSREMTLAEIKKSKAWRLDEDPLQTLKNCDGYYVSPVSPEGKRLGPLVAYAGTYEDGNGQKKNKVGFEYFNFAKAEQDPAVLDYFADKLAIEMKDNLDFVPTLVIGAPMGGILLANALARRLGCRGIFAEKKIIAPADPKSGSKEKSELIIDRHEIRSDDKVIIVEDVCNNFSTTDKLIGLIRRFKVDSIAIACAFNRSGHQDLAIDTGLEIPTLPVIAAHFIPTEQFRQEDPEVAELMAADKIVWKPKQEWKRLKMAMS